MAFQELSEIGPTSVERIMLSHNGGNYMMNDCGKGYENTHNRRSTHLTRKYFFVIIFFRQLHHTTASSRKLKSSLELIAHKILQRQ